LKSHLIGNETDYFYNVSIENNSLLDDFDFENTYNINNEFRILNIRKRNRFRKLESDSFCSDMQYSFVRNYNKSLSFIFELNYSKIRKLSFAIVFLTLGIIAISIPLNIYLGKKRKYKINLCIGCINVLILLIWIAKIIISFYLFYYIEKGDIEKYDDFLDCPKVKRIYFEKFSDIENLRKCFLAFAVFNIISGFIDKIEEVFDTPED